MQTVVDNLKNDIHYFVHESDERYPSLEEAEEAGEIAGIELTYYCPYCDCPNTVAHTTPVPDGTIDECRHCDRANTITPENENRVAQYYAADFHNYAKELERKRVARLVGERDPDAVNRATIAELIVTPAIGITISTAVMLLALAPVLGATLFFQGSVMALLVGLFVGVSMWWFLKHIDDPLNTVRHWVAGDTIHEPPKDLIDNSDMIEHGLHVARDDEPLYVPPDSDIDDEQQLETHRETELETR